MSEIEYKQVKITKLFTTTGGNGKFTKKFCAQNKGEYPLYSSNNSEIFANINTFNYDGDYLTWSVVGFAGYVTKLSGKFSITNNRGILIPTDMCENIDLDYIKYMIEPIFRNSKKGRLGHNGQNEYTTLNMTAIKKINEKISIPIKADGSFDLDIQKEIVHKYEIIEQTKNTLT